MLFGNTCDLVYVNNPKAACTFAQNVLFCANHGYMYFNPLGLHSSKYAFWRLGGTPIVTNADALARLHNMKPTVFSFVRDPVRRLISGFHSKLIRKDDTIFDDFRDNLTCRGNIDLSTECNKQKSILMFGHWLLDQMSNPNWVDPHFKPQVYNLYPNGDPSSRMLDIDKIIKIEDPMAINDFASEYTPNMSRGAGLFNESRDLNVEAYCSEELTKLAYRLFEIDYDLLSYPKGLRTYISASNPSPVAS
jgi:Sulfotransferase family